MSTPSKQEATNLVFVHGFADSPKSPLLHWMTRALPKTEQYYNVVAPELGASVDYADNTRIYMPYPIDRQEAVLASTLQSLPSKSDLFLHSQGHLAGAHAFGRVSTNQLRHVFSAAPVIDPATEYNRVNHEMETLAVPEQFENVQNHLLTSEGIDESEVLHGLKQVICYRAPDTRKPRRYVALTEAYIDSLEAVARNSDKHLDNMGTLLKDDSTLLILAQNEQVTDATPATVNKYFPYLMDSSIVEISGADHNFSHLQSQVAQLMVGRSASISV